MDNAAGVRLRPAALADAALLARLKHQAWLETYRGIYSDSLLDNFDEAAHAERFLQKIRGNEEQVWLVEADRVPAGYFCFGKPQVSSLQEKQALNALYLLKSFQRQGLGSAVFAWLNQECRRQAIPSFGCRCNLHNQSALAFYRAQGGQITAVDKGHADSREDQISLHFEIRD